MNGSKSYSAMQDMWSRLQSVYHNSNANDLKDRLGDAMESGESLVKSLMGVCASGGGGEEYVMRRQKSGFSSVNSSCSSQSSYHLDRRQECASSSATSTLDDSSGYFSYHRQQQYNNNNQQQQHIPPTPAKSSSSSFFSFPQDERTRAEHVVAKLVQAPPSPPSPPPMPRKSGGAAMSVATEESKLLVVASKTPMVPRMFPVSSPPRVEKLYTIADAPPPPPAMGTIPPPQQRKQQRLRAQQQQQQQQAVGGIIHRTMAMMQHPLNQQQSRPNKTITANKSFDDEISAISAHTLEEMERLDPTLLYVQRVHSDNTQQPAFNALFTTTTTTTTNQQPTLPVAADGTSHHGGNGNTMSPVRLRSRNSKNPSFGTKSTISSDFNKLWKREEQKYWDNVLEQEQDNMIVMMIREEEQDDQSTLTSPSKNIIRHQDGDESPIASPGRTMEEEEQQQPEMSPVTNYDQSQTSPVPSWQTKRERMIKKAIGARRSRSYRDLSTSSSVSEKKELYFRDFHISLCRRHLLTHNTCLRLFPPNRMKAIVLRPKPAAAALRF